MAAITLYTEQSLTATCVPNIFIDEYMTHANGEYVKIYLYLLRSINRMDCSFSLSQIADHFDCTERDILRALKYWERKRLFGLEYDSEGTLSGIRFVSEVGHDMPRQKDSGLVDAADRFIAASDPAKHIPTADELGEFCEREDVKELVFISEQYLGRTLNQNDLSTVFFWHDELGFSAELIEFLIETCVSGGHKNLRYMQRVAEDYASKGITTVEDARAYSGENGTLGRMVAKAFGIRGRLLAPGEMAYVSSWSDKLGFSPEMISEACARTIAAIHEPSFEYANSILEKWHSSGVRTMEDAKKADEAHRQSSQRGRRAVASAGRFANFQQRENDYEEIQSRLIQKSFQ